MRYIYYIIVIFLVLSAIMGYELLSKRQPQKNPAIIINGRVITVEEFEDFYASRSSRDEEKSDFIHSLITKELLIQESQKEGIDKEESFRRSIQNYYEQSLIKLLMDRKLASGEISVSDDEANRYLTLLNKKFHLTIFSFGSMEEAGKTDYRDGEKRAVYFEDLSRDIRNSVVPLKEGEMTGPVKAGESYLIIRIERIETVPHRIPSNEEKEKIKEMLREEKREKMINDWIADLKKKASIKILINGED